MSSVPRLLFALSAVGLSACASNPPTPGRAPIDYRTISPDARTRSSARPPAGTAPAATPLIVDVGVSSAGLSAIDEAKAMPPQAGARPGGPLHQPKDSKAKRAVEVLRGDTLYDISRRYSVNMRALIETNDLEPPYALNPGSVIYLPPPNVHVVERGETLYSVSRRYNVDTRSLALLNTMSRPWTIWPGDELLLPPLARDQSRRTVAAAAPVQQTLSTARPPAAPSLKPSQPKPPPSSAAIAETDDPASLKLAPKPSKLPASEPKKVAANPTSARGGADFIWPVSGTVLKGFGAGEDGLRNDGVNIGVPAGTKVAAAADGEVVYAGDELSGFGNLILIRHAGGWVSAYAHAEKLLVKEGDLVIQGQPVAEAGATGSADSPQVHFELRKGREPVDPAEHLPALRG